MWSNNEYLRVLEPVAHPSDEYRTRLDRWRSEHARGDLLHRRLGNARLASGLLTVVVAVGLVESLLARFSFRRVPLLLTTAFLLCVFALLTAWKGGVA